VAGLAHALIEQSSVAPARCLDIPSRPEPTVPLHRNAMSSTSRLAAGLAIVTASAALASQQESAPVAAGQSVYPEPPPGSPPRREIGGASAATEAEMKTYTDQIPGSEVTFTMLPILSGRFWMGSPEDEADRGTDEGPRHEVAVGAFWMGRCEVTWDEYQVFQFKLDQEQRKADASRTVEQDAWADAVSRPTPPYVPMDFEMGVKGYPAICMTQFAAKQYCKWLSMKTGRFYRLPTEAEWEYACRAGTETAYSFGADPGALDDHAWSFENSEDAYHRVALKKPNPWGLHDMHGNVWEWVLDGYEADYTNVLADGVIEDPILWPTELYPRVVRGGSWDADPEDLRSATRRKSRKGWKVQDPQLPKSIWYHTNATDVGFRIVRPLHEPGEADKLRYWEADLDEIRDIQQKQRRGGR
jgi:formylglycine-generating enzyme required for sulfatase activity